MSTFRIYSTKSKSKKKPGWQKAEAEYNAWLASVQGMSSGIKPVRPVKSKAIISPVVTQAVLRDDQTSKIKSKCTGGAGTLKVQTPERLYAGNDELIERERAARQRKFNAAPAYNKGGDTFVTEEELVNTLRTNKRR